MVPPLGLPLEPGVGADYSSEPGAILAQFPGTCAPRAQALRWIAPKRTGRRGTRRAFPSAVQTTVLSYLTSDLEQADHLLDEIVRMVGDGELERAEHTLGELATGVRRHIRIEEEMLFPLFIERTGILRGPVVTMRIEHRELHRVLNEMEESLERHDLDAFREACGLLDCVLPGHSVKEGRVFYPMLESLLTPEDTSQLVAEMRRFRG
jgi:iron-sulfur cluster repair protein YtfE (RIC family)